MGTTAKSVKKGGTRFEESDSCVLRINGLARDGTTEPVSRDRVLRPERGQGENMFPVPLTTGRVGNQIAVDPFAAERGDHTNLS